MVDDLMGVESEGFESELGYVKTQELDDLGDCGAACGREIVRVVCTDQGVGVGTVLSEVEETAGSGENRISVLQVGDLHGGRLYRK